MGGSLTPEELSYVNKSDIKYFVETGTYKGETTMLVAPCFDHVYTIEIHQGLYEESKKKAEDRGFTNITFLNGDSLEKLKEIVPKVKEGAVFFIDAHISGADSGWNGENRVPIFEEMEIILSEELGPSVFIVVGLRLWKNKTWDWAHVTNEKLLEKVTSYGYKISTFYEKDDRFYIFFE